MTPIERIVAGSVDRWLARGGQTIWTASDLCGEFERFLTTAPPEEKLTFVARIDGFAEAMREARALNAKEKQDG